MHYWWVYFAGGMIFETAIMIWRDTRPRNAIRRFIVLLNIAAKQGLGDKTINELLQDAELVNLDIHLKGNSFRWKA